MSRFLVDSGIDWIGKIPESWNINKVKYVCKYYNGIGHENEQDYDGKYVLINSKFISTNGNVKKYTENQLFPLFKNDICFVLSDLPSGKALARTYLVMENNKYTLNQRIAVLRNSDINPKFLFYFLNRNQFFLNYDDGCNQTNLKKENVLNCPLLIPNSVEQIRIVNYLDKKCSKIDEIIKDNNREIELLEEYKINILDSACLKGVEEHEYIKVNHYSINKIPVGWKFQNVLSTLLMPITDGPHSTPNLIDNGIPFISADAIKDGKIDFSRKRGDISEEDYIEFSKKYIPKLNDIYMIKSGATTGKVGVVETTDKFTIWSPLAVYRSNETIIFFKYLYYLLQTNFYQEQVQLNWSFGTQQNIGMRVLEKLKVLVPPLKEQKQIVKYIDNQFYKIDEVIEYRKQIIEKLEEYKKSLIYECVTGKREV